LRLDERSAVIAHWLVSSVWVLACKCVDCADEYENDQNKGKGGVDNEEDDTHDTGHQARLVEDVREYQKEDGVEEVDSANRNVENVGALVHPWPNNTSSNQGSCLNEDKCDSLNGSNVLSEGNEHSLYDNVDQDRENEVVRGSPELDVEETPFVESSRVRIQNVGRILVHFNRAFCDANNLGGSPCKSSSHSEEEEDGKDDFSGGINLGKLPQAENSHLWVTNENHSEHDTLENGEPAISEVLEFVALHPTHSDSKFAETLEHCHENNSEDNKNTEECKTCQEDIGGLHTSSERNSLNSLDNIRACLRGLSLVVGSCVDFMGPGEQLDGLINRSLAEGSLLDLH